MDPNLFKLDGDVKTYIIAEMSANHGQSLDQAIRIIRAIAETGADAVKLQTYTPDTITIDCDRPDFIVGKDTLWEGRKLYDLYAEAFTPWPWHEKLFQVAKDLGLDCFSSPFDPSAVDFLEQFSPCAYKIASFELVDLPLIQYVASKGRPVIMSTGMGSLAEIQDAVEVVQAANCPLALLKCTSAYPSPPGAMNLRTIKHLSETFNVPTGLSDHTLGTTVPVAAVALGAKIIEKHFTLSRAMPGPDSEFSLEPAEFKTLVQSVRITEAALGRINYRQTEKEVASKAFRRSLYAVTDIQAGELLTSHNVRSIRPAYGLPPKFLPQVLGKIALKMIEKGTPLTWSLFGETT
jgi:pseudaminic acid synthase